MIYASYVLLNRLFTYSLLIKPYSEADAARLMREVASALDFLHCVGIVHGDLKPENLMLSTENASDAAVKVIDLGTAQVLDEDGNITMPSGGRTLAYCSPEVLKQGRKAFGKNVNPTLDMWAVGIILYIIVTRNI